MLYERIKELCKKNGTNITALEKACGFGRGSISKIDKHRPSNEKLQKMADYFGITVDQLTGVQPVVKPLNIGYILAHSISCSNSNIFLRRRK